ncbi:hypothetical protein ON003_09380 [Janibacter hoylei]|uniref:hypothetical protein n=1 Tax=Janibacter hoylei TaxID=364298 RepID=UPI0022381014|nr:hypothetical protein [Janibacter hoylei]MCW4601786.1 hypothetical protein [Janibacter hoylei]
MNPGTELGRYTVASRIEEIAGGERWTARDTTLDRDVTLLVMPTDGASTPAALDAARRAAGVEAAQLVRILDVDTEGDLSWVAEESLADARTYAEAIGTDGLPAEEVRRITGEIATGVEAARARGLHHLALTPDIVLLTHDGRVKVRGLATSAALAGTETEGEEADRDDARAIVALAYAGLTGTWPLPGSTSLPAAPTSDGAPTPLRTSRWPSQATSTPSAARPSATTPARTRPATTPPRSRRGPASPSPARCAPGRPTPRSCRRSLRRRRPPRQPSPSSPRAPTATRTSPRPSTRAATAATLIVITPGRDLPAHDDGEAATEPTTTRHTGSRTADGRESEDEGDDHHGERRAAAAAAAAAAAVGAGGKVIGDRLGKAARTAGDRSKEAIHDARQRREAIRKDQRTRSSLGAAPVTAELEAPAPLLPASAGAPPSRSQSNLVLALMAGLVLVACVIGGLGSSRIGSGTDLGKILGGDETTAVQTTQSSDSGSEGDGSGEPFGIINAAGFDPPPGDGVEHNAEVQRVYDGSPQTVWTTEGYNSETFGGVKQGVGITVDLGQAQKISSVTLDLPTSAQATVYAGDQATNSGTEIGKTEGRTGQVVLEPQSEVTAQYVTIWFTSLAPSDDGRYRASLGEVTVR